MDFVIMFNNRNLTRKHAADVLFAFKFFVDNIKD